MHWYLAAFKKYATFRGRARRREYWTFHLVNLGVLLILFCVSFFLAVLENKETKLAVYFLKNKEISTYHYIQYLFSAILFLPSLSVTVRRLHDIGKSGWWCLLLFHFGFSFSSLLLALDVLFDLTGEYSGPLFHKILSICDPLSLFILFIIWMLQNSQPGANKYGENPKGIDI